MVQHAKWLEMSSTGFLSNRLQYLARARHRNTTAFYIGVLHRRSSSMFIGFPSNRLQYLARARHRNTTAFYIGCSIILTSILVFAIVARQSGESHSWLYTEISSWSYFAHMIYYNAASIAHFRHLRTIRNRIFKFELDSNPHDQKLQNIPSEDMLAETSDPFSQMWADDGAIAKKLIVFADVLYTLCAAASLYVAIFFICLVVPLSPFIWHISSQCQITDETLSTACETPAGITATVFIYVVPLILNFVDLPMRSHEFSFRRTIFEVAISTVFILSYFIFTVIYHSITKTWPSYVERLLDPFPSFAVGARLAGVLLFVALYWGVRTVVLRRRRAQVQRMFTDSLLDSTLLADTSTFSLEDSETQGDYFETVDGRIERVEQSRLDSSRGNSTFSHDFEL